MIRSAHCVVTTILLLGERAVCTEGTLRATHPSGGAEAIGTAEVTILICAAVLVAAGIVWFMSHKWGSPPQPKWAARERCWRETVAKIKVVQVNNPTCAHAGAVPAQGKHMTRVSAVLPLPGQQF